MDIRDYVEAGLYDSNHPDAATRLELLEFLVSEGFTVEEMVEADARGRLFGLVGDKELLQGGLRYTLREIAEQCGLDVEFVRRLWRALGLADPGGDAVVATAGDVHGFSRIKVWVDRWGETATIGVVRVIGSAAARLADAGSAAGRSSTPAASVATSNELATARYYKASVESLRGLGDVVEGAARHHADASRRRFDASNSFDVMLERQARFAVAFVDMSGYTELSQSLTAQEISALASGFEELMTAMVAGTSTRVVKFAGDAALVVSPSSQELADVCLRAVSARGWSPVPIRVRAGMSYGELVTQDGDVFGSDANLAARLVSLAEPGTVVATRALIDQLDRTLFETRELPAQRVKGVAEPVKLFVVSDGYVNGPDA